MKIFSPKHNIIIFLSFTVLMFCASIGMTQTEWTKYPGNPVFNLGAVGEWDDYGVSNPTVLFNGNEYQMWYAGDDGSVRKEGIGYATSLDGITWERYINNPVLHLGVDGTWDDTQVSEPAVIFNDSIGKYQMWYAGDDSLHWRIGYANSDDGIIWQKHPNFVIDLGPSGSWDDYDVSGPAVFFDGAKYHMWYSGNDYYHWRIGYATSTDGINWEKYANNPVINYGAEGEWDDYLVSQPTILFNGNEYQIWYSGNDSVKWRIGYATSIDGIAWVKHPNNPVLNLGADDTWEDNRVYRPTVLLGNSKYQIWYTGYDGNRDRIGYATSSFCTSAVTIDFEMGGHRDLIPEDAYLDKGMRIFGGRIFEKGQTGWDYAHSGTRGMYPSNGRSTDGTTAIDIALSHGVSSWIVGPAVTDVFFATPCTMEPAIINEFSVWIGFDEFADPNEANTIIIEAFDIHGERVIDFTSQVLTGIPEEFQKFSAPMITRLRLTEVDGVGFDDLSFPIPKTVCNCPLIGDVSGNGSVTAYDAALILKYVVGLIDHFPGQDMISSSVNVPREYVVRMPEQQAKVGDRIYVPVAINDATELAAGGITLKYDSTVLKALDVMTATSLQSAYWEANTNINGEVRFAFAATKPTKGQGNLFIVEFEILPNTEGKTSPLIFDDVSLSDSTNIKMHNGSVMVLSPNFALLQNFPNPFNPETWIPYKLASDGSATIWIHDIKGRLIRTINLGNQPAGSYITKDRAVYWNGKDNSGQDIASGVYFYTLQVDSEKDVVGGFKATRRMLIVK